MSEPISPVAAEPFWLTRQWWLRAGQASAGIWLGTALAFVGSVIVARNLGPSRYGSVVLAVSLAGLISTLLDLTLEEALVFYGSQRLAQQDSSGLRGLVRSAVLVDIVNGAIVLGLMLALSEFIARFLGGVEADASLFRVAAAAAFATTINGTTGAVLLLARRADIRAWLTAWTALVRLTAVVVALGLGTRAMGVMIAFVSAAAIGAITQAVSAWVVLNHRLATTPAHHDGRTTRWAGPLIRFGVHSAISTSVLAGREALISVLFGRIAGPTALGLLSAGMLPISAASIATSGIRMALFSEQARMSARGDLQNLRRSVRGHMILGLAIGVPSAAVAFFFLPWLIPAAYSLAYSGSVEPARIMLLTAVAYMASGWAKTLPAAAGKPQVRTVIALIDLLVSAMLIWAFSNRGPVGAAWAIAVSSMVIAGIWGLVSGRIIGPIPSDVHQATWRPRETR